MKINKRDHIAIECMKLMIATQLKRRRVTPLNRVTMYLGMGGRQHFDINMPNIAIKSYECADYMIKEGEKLISSSDTDSGK